MRTSERRGFSVLELCVCVALTAMLVGMSVADVSPFTDARERVVAGERARTICAACECYFRARGRYPASLSELVDHGYLSLPDRDWLYAPAPLNPRELPAFGDAAHPHYSVFIEPSLPGRADVAFARVGPCSLREYGR